MNFDNCTCTSTPLLGLGITLDAGSFSWTRTAEYRKWAEDKPPEYNIFGYLRMVKEREYADRLEF